MTEFRVPNGVAFFLSLGENDKRDSEWDVPSHLHADKSGLYYPIECLPDMLQMITEICDCLEPGYVDAITARQSGNARYWMQQMIRKTGVKPRGIKDD